MTKGIWKIPTITPRDTKKPYHIIHTEGGTILLTKREFYNSKERANKYGYNK